MIFRNYWKTMLWAIIIMVLSGISGNEINKIHFINIPYFDKIVHFSMYLILAFLFMIDKYYSNREISVKVKLIIIISTIGFGLLMEVMQKYLFIERSAELADFIANSAGSFSSLLAYYLWGKL